ncbi:hypothetical protein B0H63DRAFT_565718 [Podospora didyma]|uniref:Uncharacterized protein n=1 Tax=Podospora didyma TaxID=330526 RepID=A0AAE0K0L7_9PEZI|nr:hypothetical protein B0H63DRAFT_565718 [Podospora didyma]
MNKTAEPPLKRWSAFKARTCPTLTFPTSGKAMGIIIFALRLFSNVFYIYVQRQIRPYLSGPTVVATLFLVFDTPAVVAALWLIVRAKGRRRFLGVMFGGHEFAMYFVFPMLVIHAAYVIGVVSYFVDYQFRPANLESGWVFTPVSLVVFGLMVWVARSEPEQLDVGEEEERLVGRRESELPAYTPIFDDASRGPWGSALMLSRVSAGSVLGSTLALVMVAGLGIEPSAQNILDFRLQTVVLTNTTAEMAVAAEDYDSEAFAEIRKEHQWLYGYRAFDDPYGNTINHLMGNRLVTADKSANYTISSTSALELFKILDGLLSQEAYDNFLPLYSSQKEYEDIIDSITKANLLILDADILESVANNLAETLTNVMRNSASEEATMQMQ